MVLEMGLGDYQAGFVWLLGFVVIRLGLSLACVMS